MWPGDVNVGSGAFNINNVKNVFLGAATVLMNGFSLEKLMSFRSLEELQAKREDLTVRCRHLCPCFGVPAHSRGVEKRNPMVSKCLLA